MHVDVPEMTPSQMKFTRLMKFHSGGITALVADRSGHGAVSGDAAGSVWAYDLQSQSFVCTRAFPTGVTCITGASAKIDTKESVWYVGHQGGFLRQLLRCTDGWHLRKCCRPHQQSVVAMAVSPDGASLVTCGGEGHLFFFCVEDNCLEPHAAVNLSKSPVSMVWTEIGVVVACEAGILLCVQPPDNHDHTTAASFLCEAKITEQTFMLPKSLWPKPPANPGSGDEAADADDKTGAAMAVERATSVHRCRCTEQHERHNQEPDVCLWHTQGVVAQERSALQVMQLKETPSRRLRWTPIGSLMQMPLDLSRSWLCFRIPKTATGLCCLQQVQRVDICSIVAWARRMHARCQG